MGLWSSALDVGSLTNGLQASGLRHFVLVAQSSRFVFYFSSVLQAKSVGHDGLVK